MAENIKLFDAGKCTGCRGCQLACKQWNSLPAKQTVNWGSYQNPPTLQPNTFLIMRFQETADAKGVKWFYRHEACMHCTDAACVKACPTGSLYYSEMKTVGKIQEKCIGCKDCVSACPFGVPKYDPESNKMYKCDMCESRITNKLEPACVKACPTGALKWGDKEAMLKVANDRAKELGSDAHVYGPQYVGGTHLTYVLQEKDTAYAGLVIDPKVPLSVIVWKDWLKPLSLIAGGGALVGAILHYVLHGPKRPDPEVGPDNHAEGGK